MLHGWRSSAFPALVGRVCFPALVARVGRLRGWRSLGCAVMSTQQTIAFKVLILRSDVALSVCG